MNMLVSQETCAAPLKTPNSLQCGVHRAGRFTSLPCPNSALTRLLNIIMNIAVAFFKHKLCYFQPTLYLLHASAQPS